MPNRGHFWTAEEEQQIVELLPRHGDQEIGRILADAFRVTPHAVRLRAAELRKRLGIPAPPRAAEIPNPEQEGYVIRWVDYLRIPEDTMVCGDFQVPFFHREAVRRLMQVAERYNIRSLTIGGDFFDLAYWSKYDYTRYAQKLDWDNDRRIGRELLLALAHQFDRIYLVADNHTRRALRKLDFKTGFRGFYAWVVGEEDPLAEKIIASDYPLAEAQGNWLIVHPSAYRQLKLSLASDLALKYGRNILNYHGHMAAMGFSKYANYIVCDGGCMTDPQLHEYVAIHPTAHPTWNVGFYMLRDGWAHPFWLHPQFPWEFYLGDDRAAHRAVASDPGAPGLEDQTPDTR